MTKKNRNYGNNYGQQFNENEELKVTQMGGNLVETDIDSDAWGRPKFIQDITLFHSLFTFNIPSTWLVFENGVEIANASSTKIVSDSGHGSIKSGVNIGDTGFLLGQNTTLTIANPALSAGLYCENTDGTEVEIRIGCVDITSEGGKVDEAEYRSVTNDAIKTVDTANYPVLILHSKTTFNGLPNTRDLQAYRATGNSDQRAFMKAYITRDPTAITGASFVDLEDDSSVEYDVSATAINTAKCHLLWNKRIEANSSGTVDIPSGNVEFYLTAGDYLIITMQRENPILTALVNAFIEFGEEI